MSRRTEGAVRHPVRVAAGGWVLLALAVSMGCGGTAGPTAPDGSLAPLDATLETANYVFRFASGDGVDSAWQEAFHEQATAQLGVSMPQKIRYNKYRDRAHMQALTGRAANGWAEPETFTVHSIFRFHGHEAIHVYTHRIGRPSDFFNEGIAVAMTVDPFTGAHLHYSGVHAHSQARSYLQQGRLAPLADCITTDGFRRLDEGIGYPEAGSFVTWLIDEYGMERLLEMFRGGSRFDDAARIGATLRSIYGLDLDEAERQWHEFLETWSGG